MSTCSRERSLRREWSSSAAPCPARGLCHVCRALVDVARHPRSRRRLCFHCWARRRRRAAVALSLALFVTFAAAVATSAPAKHTASDRVTRLSQTTLEREARRVAGSGGIVCHTVGVGAGCATPYMRRLTRELVARAFAMSSRTWALCVATRESGFNPAALSHTNDHGVGQLNHRWHPWVDLRRIARRSSSSPTGWVSDPVYSVAVFAALADRGANRGPWEAAPYTC